VKFVFDHFTLDLNKGQLLLDGEAVPLEPRAFTLLNVLLSNPDRLVSKDELIEKVWEGRIVSEAAVSTVVKTLRRAIGDDGSTQRYIRTVHGRGFRFAGEVKLQSATPATAAGTDDPEDAEDVKDASDRFGGRPAIAILPFKLIGTSNEFVAIADAIPSELISTLSRLRWLKAIARGSTFRFRDQILNPQTIRETLGANYLLSGDVELLGSSLSIYVELSDTRTGQVIWGERRSGKIDEVHKMREEFVGTVISALELHVPQHEAALARLRSPDSLDAWACFHLGLQHMYRFNAKDNSSAAAHFAKATEIDPNFARAFAARSFTSFQAAFLRYGEERNSEIENAMRFAEKSVELDPMEPFGNFNFGRAHWLKQDPLAGQAWLERSLSLSPSFAQGYYAHAWADIMAGKGEAALEALERAIMLSPLDPFLYAMQSAKGLAFLHTGDLENAAYWAEQGARKPGAHYLICAVAAALSEIAGKGESATYWTGQTFFRRPDASVQKFFTAFPFANPFIRSELNRALFSLKFPES